jgi:signal transduction histidine kinase
MGFTSYRSALISASLITVASFVGATAYTQSRLERLDALSSTIESNAGPSLEYLGRAAIRLRRVEQLLRDLRSGNHRKDETGTARRELLALDKDVSDYLSLTPLPGERELWNVLRANVHQATGVAQSMLDAEESGDDVKASLLLGGVEATFDRAGQAMRRTLEFDANQVQTLAREVRAVRRNTLTTIVVLDALASAIAVSAALIAYRAAREHDRLLQQHNSLLSTRITELDRFAGRMAHDVLSPLDTIAITMGLVARHADSSAKQYIDRAHSALQRVRQLVEGLLAFARSGAKPGADEGCSLSEVLGPVTADAAHVAQEKGITLVVEPYPQMNVACSAAVLTSILQNLVCNAIKYMGEQKTRRVSVRAKRLNGRLGLEIEDSGPGIPEDLHSTIFEPFTRGRHQLNEGVGLGLATVKRLTDAHGGTVVLRSKVGVGTIFCVELPLAKASEDSASDSERGFGSSGLFNQDSVQGHVLVEPPNSPVPTAGNESSPRDDRAAATTPISRAL